MKKFYVAAVALLFVGAAFTGSQLQARQTIEYCSTAHSMCTLLSEDSTPEKPKIDIQQDQMAKRTASLN